MKAIAIFLLRLTLLPLFVLLIAPVGVLIRLVADPLQIRRNTLRSMLRPAGPHRAASTAGVAVPASRGA